MEGEVFVKGGDEKGVLEFLVMGMCVVRVEGEAKDSHRICNKVLKEGNWARKREGQ